MLVSIRIIAVVLVLCFTLLGLLAVFGIIPRQTLLDNMLELGMAAGLLVAAAVGLKLLLPGGGKSGGAGGKTESPPQL